MGNIVYGIEPHSGMQLHKNKTFLNNSQFHFLNEIAENTRLSPHSMDAVTVAQTFHWFNPKIFCLACLRI